MKKILFSLVLFFLFSFAVFAAGYQEEIWQQIPASLKVKKTFGELAKNYTELYRYLKMTPENFKIVVGGETPPWEDAKDVSCKDYVELVVTNWIRVEGVLDMASGGNTQMKNMILSQWRSESNETYDILMALRRITQGWGIPLRYYNYYRYLN
jgi:hypothetical protein